MAKFIPQTPGRPKGNKTRTGKEETEAFLLYLEGKTIVEIAKLLGRAEKTVGTWSKAKEGKKSWAERRAEFTEQYQAKILEQHTKARVKEIEAAAKEHATLTKLVKNSAARELQRLDQEVAELLAELKNPDEKKALAAFKELRAKRYNRALSSNLFASNIFKAIEADRTRLDMDNFDPERDRKVKAVYELQLTLNGNAVDVDKVRQGFSDQDPYEYTEPEEAKG